MKYKNIIIGMMTTLLLAGCMSTQLNEVTDWKKYGFEQASRGKPIIDKTLISSEQFEDYNKGYALGSEVYCAQDPYKLGMRGADYNGQCDSKHAKFQEQYDLGMLEYLAYQSKLRNSDY